MEVYIVIENGESYPKAYRSFEEARSVVKQKYRKYLEEMIRDCDFLEEMESIVNDINVPENKETGKTQIYINQNDLYIYIQKLPIH